MFDQLIGTVLFFFGLAGTVRGDSTSSATVASQTRVTAEERELMRKKFLESRSNAENNWVSKRNTFSASLNAVNDEKKKALVTNLQTRLQEINQNQSTRSMQTITQLTAGLEVMQNIADAYAKETGADVSNIRAAFSTARAALTEAATLVTAQVGHTYVIRVTSDATLKANFGTQRSALAADLIQVRTALQKARNAVRDAQKIVKQVTKRTETILVPIETLPATDVTAAGAVAL